MILTGKKLKNTLFRDSRGHYGESGQLHISEDIRGTRFLVKSKPSDVTNEYVVHRIARLIGVPTSDAVLIETNGFVEVGIIYKRDFRHVSLDDFVGDANYPDDSPYLADLMAYLALRDMVAMGDNHQLAFSGKRLISYDYADSFYMHDSLLGAIQMVNDISLPVSTFANQLILGRGYLSAIRILQRPNTDFLLNAYLDPIVKFQEVDLTQILADLNELYPPVVPAFYMACFDEIRKAYDEMAEGEDS